MKIIDIKPNWMIRWSNRPTLQILIDKFPKDEDFLFEQKGPLYFAEFEDYVRFFCYSKPGDGFGGREFKLKMKDGAEKILYGPWSSRAGVMNKVGFTPCLDVALTDDKRIFDDPLGGVWSGGAVTLESVREWMKENKPDFYLVQVGEFESEEPYWIPSIEKDKVVKPKE
jgi:hypothetical protein